MYKSISIFALASLLSLTASATNIERPDTTFTYRGMAVTLSGDEGSISVDVKDGKGNSVSQVYVSSSDSTARVQTWNVDDSFTFSDLLPRNWRGHRKSSFSAHSDYFYAGFNKAFGGDVDNEIWYSTEIGFNVISHDHACGANHGLWYGLGFNWRNWRLDGDRWFTYSNKKVATAAAPDTMDIDFSRLRSFRFNIPLAYEWQSLGGKPFFIQVGAEAEISPMVRIKTTYKTTAGDDRTIRHKDIRHNILGCSVFATFGYKDWALYARYIPTPLFSSKRGPDFTALTFGIKYCL